MYRTERNVQTGEITVVHLTDAEIAEAQARAAAAPVTNAEAAAMTIAASADPEVREALIGLAETLSATRQDAAAVAAAQEARIARLEGIIAALQGAV